MVHFKEINTKVDKKVSERSQEMVGITRKIMDGIESFEDKQKIELYFTREQI